MDDTPRPDLVEEVRVRVPLPIVIPVVAIAVIGLVAFGVSRILLNVTPNVAVALALVMAVNVLGACAYVALKPTPMTAATWAELFVVLTYPVIIGFVITQTGIAGAEGHGGEEHAPGGGGTETSAPKEPGAPSSDLAITAVELEWDTDALVASANAPLNVTVENEDATVHNFSVYEDESLAKELFIGADVAPNESIEEKLDPLKEGEYYFQCDYHPSMNGTLTAE
jgi:plastocyanin